MKTHAEAYQPFILDGTVAQYCASQIDPYQVEIEHIGMNALIDALVKPAGFAVEISYLDRSPGVEVNTHRFEATAADGTALYHDAPTMYLLYRPYGPPPPPSNLPVFLSGRDLKLMARGLVVTMISCTAFRILPRPRSTWCRL